MDSIGKLTVENFKACLNGDNGGIQALSNALCGASVYVIKKELGDAMEMPPIIAIKHIVTPKYVTTTAELVGGEVDILKFLYEAMADLPKELKHIENIIGITAIEPTIGKHGNDVHISFGMHVVVRLDRDG